MFWFTFGNCNAEMKTSFERFCYKELYHKSNVENYLAFI